MKLPAQLLINGIVYRVRTDVNDALAVSGMSGANRLNELEIWVKNDLPPDRVANTLLHESIHAILYEAGHECHDDELVVNSIANGIFNMLRQNDMRWLTGKAKQ